MTKKLLKEIIKEVEKGVIYKGVTYMGNCEDNENKSPLVKLGEAIDNGEFSGIVSNYKCEKCGRQTTWETYIGFPIEKIPCGSSCGGNLILQS